MLPKLPTILYLRELEVSKSITFYLLTRINIFSITNNTLETRGFLFREGKSTARVSNLTENF